MNQNNFCVIMAGGVGSRFWPLSRTEKPKQFIDILSAGRTLIQQTYDRFKDVCPIENFFIVTSDVYVDLVQQQLPEIPKNNILAEPARRNTAPCIAYAMYKIQKINPFANVVVTPADHLVLYPENFREVINKAIDFSQNHNSLLTIGIKPTRPETGYGYIQICNDCDKLPDWINKVKVFTEKPDLEMATFFFESDEFLWNSGIFIWNLKSIFSAFNSYLPEMINLFNNSDIYNSEKEVAFIEDVYKKVQTVSIDIGIMEKADNVFVIPADFGWSDLGTWGSLYDYHTDKDKDKNVTNSKNVFLYNTKNSIINVPKDKLVVINGLDNIIVAESDDLLLISAFSDEQKIRQIVTDIKVEKGEKFV